MKLAVVTGLRSMLGPALVAEAANRSERKNLALAAMAEMIADKLPLVPSRDRLLPLLIRGLAGAWVARTIQEEEAGVAPPDPWIAPLGAAVAMGVAVAAPKLRKTLTATTGIADPVLGLIEDYLALRLGGDAVGLSMEELPSVARGAIEDLKERVEPVFQEVGGSMHQSVGAGSI
jgi:uncharacterized membrane protein